MTKKKKVQVVVGGRMHDTWVQDVHTGGAFKPQAPAEIELSAEMKPKARERELGPDDRKALRDAVNVLEGFSFKVRRIPAKGVVNGVRYELAFTEAKEGEPRFLISDYWKMIDEGFSPSQVANQIINLAAQDVADGNII